MTPSAGLDVEPKLRDSYTYLPIDSRHGWVLVCKGSATLRKLYKGHYMLPTECPDRGRVFLGERASEHRRSGKRGTLFQVVQRVRREVAKDWERKQRSWTHWTESPPVVKQYLLDAVR